ncbi:MAG: hypothetical protein AAB658_10265, partial [Chloroflexota bacterium]
MDTTLSDRSSHRSPLMLRSAGGVALAVILSLGVFYLLMSPPMDEVGLMALFLTVTAMISVAAGCLPRGSDLRKAV